MEQRFDCIVCGNLVADVIGRPLDVLTPRYNVGHTKLEQIRLFTGGFACNVPLALAKLGLKAGVIGRLGDDEWKDLIVGRLRANAVDVNELITDPQKQTSTTIVCVDSNGERTFYHAIGAHQNLSANDVLERLGYIQRAGIFALGYYGILPAMENDLPGMLKRLKGETSAKVLLDTCGSVGPTLPALARSLPYVDFFIPSFHEAVQLTRRHDPDEMVKIFRDCGAPFIVGVKLGGDGCLLDDGKGRVRAPAFRAPKVIDTTGAGDSFLAGIIAAYLRGLDLKQTARFANAVGNCCVQALGATTGIRSFEETMKML